MKGKIRTILGDIDPNELGFTMAHEHVLDDPRVGGYMDNEHVLNDYEKARESAL
jgi:phosphotriesterase-related protein